MTINLERAQEAIGRCRALRELGHVEAVLRGEFQGWLRLMFPDKADETWINNYSEGTESHTKIATASNTVASRFIDNLVGATTIEYEGDLRNKEKRETGFAQVREQIAGLVRSGVPVTRVRGILSDTVDWYAYDAELLPGAEAAACTAASIVLNPVDGLELATNDLVAAERLVRFIRKHLAREQSRPLRSEFLVSDLGVDSATYKSSIPPLAALVSAGRTREPSANLATELWSQFIDHLEGDAGSFRSDAYVDEAYLTTVARLLGANVLAGNALLSSDAELADILTGSFFRHQFHLQNLVEQDYFGWLLNPVSLDAVVIIARALQRDLYAYDFTWQADEDLFGHLMAQLARRSQRKLLGQEWTPHWLAKLLAERCLDGLPNGTMPRILDMCCGSGTIIAEIIKAARTRYGFTTIEQMVDVATGFDIDPLAVSLAKTTWVVSLAAEIKTATQPIVIPIYHADSLFAVTPVSAAVPLPGETNSIPVSLDGVTVELPANLLRPAYRAFFDHLVDWAYDEAREAQRRGTVEPFAKADADAFLDGAIEAFAVDLDTELHDQLKDALFPLARRMAELAAAGRNGIWAFILRNTYRPGLLTGHFTGLVSNPPWLAMSGLADNPYRDLLKDRAKLYGIQPEGQSFLHLELGTMHLLHAVDRYLGADASIACLVPGTTLNGHHHERLRAHEYLTAKRPVAFDLREVWQVAPGTFKYPGAALIGTKSKSVADVPQSKIAGALATKAGLEYVELSVQRLNEKRSAWVFEKLEARATSITDIVLPLQGADLMSRTAVCIEILAKDGAEYRVDTPDRTSPWGFTIKSAKEMAAERFPGNVAPRFIFRMAQSGNLLPFTLGPHLAPLALPALRSQSGSWVVLGDTEIRRMGFVQTARRFVEINRKLEAVGKGKSLQARIDERGKLSKQAFGATGFLVLAGAGGKNICAACVSVADAEDLVIDQTLYWKVVPDKSDAWFQVGMLNSRALTNATLPFNPKGDFSERHLHTLPYRLMPSYDPNDPLHVEIALLSEQLAQRASNEIKTDPYLAEPANALTARRRKLHKMLSSVPSMNTLESLATQIMTRAQSAGATALELKT